MYTLSSLRKSNNTEKNKTNTKFEDIQDGKTIWNNFQEKTKLTTKLWKQKQIQWNYCMKGNRSLTPYHQEYFSLIIQKHNIYLFILWFCTQPWQFHVKRINISRQSLESLHLSNVKSAQIAITCKRVDIDSFHNLIFGIQTFEPILSNILPTIISRKEVAKHGVLYLWT